MRESVVALFGIMFCLQLGAETPALPAETRALFESVRSAAIARRAAMLGDADSLSIRRLRGATLERSSADVVSARFAHNADGTRTQWVSEGLLRELDARANGRARFAQRVLALIFARQLVSLWTISPVDRAEVEAVRVFDRLGLAGGALGVGEIRAAVELLTESRAQRIECRRGWRGPLPGVTTRCRQVPRWRVRLNYGSVERQVGVYQAAVEALSRDRGLSGRVGGR